MPSNKETSFGLSHCLAGVMGVSFVLVLVLLAVSVVLSQQELQAFNVYNNNNKNSSSKVGLSKLMRDDSTLEDVFQEQEEEVRLLLYSLMQIQYV